MRKTAHSSALLLLLICLLGVVTAQGECRASIPQRHPLAVPVVLSSSYRGYLFLQHLVGRDAKHDVNTLHSYMLLLPLSVADALATLQEDPASRSCALFFVVRPNQAPVTCDKVLQTFTISQKELETLNPGMKCMPGQPVPRGTLMCVKGGSRGVRGRQAGNLTCLGGCSHTHGSLQKVHL